MSIHSAAKPYYIFMFLLPLFFLNGISDMVLLPRQLFLTGFTAFLLVSVLRTTKNHKTVELDVVPIAILIYFLIAATVSFCSAVVISESFYVLSKLWILFSFVCLTIWLLKNNTITIQQIIKAVIIFGCAAIVTALFDIANKTIQGSQLFHNIHNISGGFANKNLLASILFLCLPFFMIGCQAQKKLKWVSALALIFAILILLIIRTRAALLGTMIFFGIVLFFFLRNFLKPKIWWASIFVLGLSIVIFLQVKLEQTAGQFQSSPNINQQYFYRLIDTNTFKSRVLFWQNSLEMFREYPFGVGLGNWQVYFPKYGLEKFHSFNMVNGIDTLQRPHNDFLWVLNETGILGFITFLAIFLIIIYQSASLIKTAENQYQKRLFIYIFSAIIGFMFIAFFDFPMERIEHQVILLLLFAIVIHQYGVKNRNSFKLSIKKIGVLLFFVLGCCFSFATAYKRLQSERLVYQLYQARTVKDTKEVLALAKKAENNFYKVDSKTIPLQWYIGAAYFSEGQLNESEASFEEAYKLTPFNIHVINNLASCYEINGKSGVAIETYLKALQISPGFEEARLNLAAAYFNIGAYDKAFHTIDYCSVQTRDPKYKIFLPVILKNKADLILKNMGFQVSAENKNIIENVKDFSPIYYESKKNNVTFEQQLIRQLKNPL